MEQPSNIDTERALVDSVLLAPELLGELGVTPSDFWLGRHMQGNPEQFKSYLKIWGWLCNSAIRACRELESLRRSVAVDDVATNRVLEAYDDEDANHSIARNKTDTDTSIMVV